MAEALARGGWFSAPAPADCALLLGAWSARTPAVECTVRGIEHIDLAVAEWWWQRWQWWQCKRETCYFYPSCNGRAQGG